MTTGIVVFAHGSRIEPANEAVRTVAAHLARAGPFEFVEAAFLELGRPDLEEAVTGLAEKGVGHVVVVPYFVTLGLHVERDLPRIVEDISRKHNSLRISVAPPLDGHPALVQILAERVRAVIG